ncbi:bifunctional acetate--CoA ligase family protein/GNAT family N-acetyltransferase [Neisseria animalis]|uniref:GNAT family N-acetyltransferase n=1 Tax=Neisseria animalis TaxID=492 RepID=A0A5P3MPZ1_NEIAN|nr:bifunctional acetate--CoA ligase family protein/GNAT family N-acetyltransferase [Neisseria animalis]QEY23626.1 GNAT family N-acetyltransferase [Neisseria animalis]ROW32905.1 GNAT family N-acetyltransferase [Neisseria animalis]VEE09363.1 putative N-acetyltransferase [Neisseria animalis]
MPAQPMPGYFFSPQHIILVGASERAHSLGERILSALLGSAYQGKITPVNLRHPAVAGLQAYSALSKIREPADLVLAVTPPDSYDALFRACRKQQFHHVIVIQDWETHNEDAWRTAAAAIRRHNGDELNISVCNSAAIQLPANGLNTGILPDFPAGHTAILTGATSVSSEISQMLQRMRQGVSRHISLNYALSPTTSADWLNRFGHNRHTRVAVVHYNPLENPRKLFSAIRSFTRHTPLVLYSSHDADTEERAVLHALARHANFLPVFGSEELEAALHAALGNLKPVANLSILSDTPSGWLDAPARAFGINTIRPSEKTVPRHGYIGSHPTPTQFRSFSVKALQNNHTEALLTVIAPKSNEDELAATQILKRLAQQSDTPLLISSKNADGLLHFSRPMQALQAISLCNTAEHLRQIQQQIAPPKSGRLKTIHTQAVDKAIAAKDWGALADALGLPEYQAKPSHPAAQLVFKRHPHYGAVLTASTQGNTLALLPPFTTADQNRLAEFLDSGRLKNALNRLLHALNFLTKEERIFGEILIYLGSNGLSSDFKPSEKPKTRTAAKSLQNAAEFIRSRNAAAADFLLHTGEAAAGLLSKTEADEPPPPETVLAPYPSDYPQTLTLKNGQTATVRPFEPEDAEAKQTFVRSLSPEARYTRFMAHTNELPQPTLARFSKLDYSSEGAFIAENADDIIIGISRFSRLSRDECEFGITLSESARGSGLAQELMRQIILLAAKQGYRSMSAEILKTNTAMLKLAEKTGFTLIESDQDKELYQAKLNLSATPEAPKRKFRQ